MVWEAELPAGEIATRCDVTWPAVSQNLRVLSEAGLLQARREGTKRFYRADQQAAAPVQEILRMMWMEDLQRLKQAIEDGQ